MAKLVGIFQFNGKLGETVGMKGLDGKNYVRTRVTPHNPKSPLQTDQRAKVNLAGRMTGVTPPEVLIGLGGNKRMRRSMFNKNLIDVATIDRSVPGTVTAKVQPADISFSHGAQTTAASMAPSPSVTASSVTLSLTLSDSALASKYGERVVVAVIDPSDKAGYSLLKYDDVVFDNTSAQSVTINLGTDIADQSLVCVYRLPFLLTEQSAAQRTETLANDGTDIIAKILSSSGSAVRDWGESTLAYTQVFTRA